MKLIIGDYEVEIKAKKIGLDERANKQATVNFLNETSIAYLEASRMYAIDGYTRLAPAAEKKSNDIYNKLSEMGFYKHL